MTKRKTSKAHIPAREKLAAALLMCMQPDATGKLVRVIPHDEAKRLTAKQIIARFDFHHWPIEEQDGGPAEAWNLSPMLRKCHQRETGRLRKQRTKGKRIREKYNTDTGAAVAAAEAALEVAVRAVLARAPKRKGRPMPGSKASPIKRKLSGKVVPRHQPPELRP